MYTRADERLDDAVKEDTEGLGFGFTVKMAQSRSECWGLCLSSALDSGCLLEHSGRQQLMTTEGLDAGLSS